ncbi:MAG: shikimate dehydrogenase [Myxococcota bacterium]
MTLRYGVLGWPVEHSRSPAMHQAAFQALGLDAEYERVPVEPGALPEAIHELRESFAGANVTVPHKETVRLLLDEVEPAAAAIGAVNTIVRVGPLLLGANTDAMGLVRSLEEEEVPLEGIKAVILGAGGAARAAAYGLQAQGANVVVGARRIAQAEALTQDLGGTPCDLGDVGDAFADAALVVQATSATLGASAEAFADALPLDALPSDASVVDLVYIPRETTVLRKARARGLRTVDGTGMLIHQGALAFERWTQRAAPVDVMRAALFRSLDDSH